jgi:UDP-glucose 4-epimerase
MRCLITGGAGFIGSHLADALTKKGNQVMVIDTLLSGKKQNLNPKIKFFRYDICNPKVFDVFKNEKPDIVYHLAGPINLRRKINDPFFNKGLGVLSSFKKILDYAHIFNIKKLIFVSSGGAIYSGAKVIPTSEDYPSHPVSFYGLANLMLERLIKEYYNMYKLNSIILRLSNIYGPRQWGSGVIPSFIKQILENKSPVINGDGKQTRDFVYIDDIIRALLISAKTKKTGIFNVGSGQEINLNELCREINKLLNTNIKPSYHFVEKEESQRSVLDCSKIKNELNWQPRVNLEAGLKKTIGWFK